MKNITKVKGKRIVPKRKQKKIKIEKNKERIPFRGFMDYLKFK